MSSRLSISKFRSNADHSTTKRLIQKAIDNWENPVKEKHVKKIISVTFQEKGAHVFWNVVLKLPLKDNKIVAWKFCHVLHRIVREGHPAVVADCQRNRGKIEDLGKSWVKLMVLKLK